MNRVERLTGFISICTVTIYGVLIWLFAPTVVGLITALTNWIVRQ